MPSYSSQSSYSSVSTPKGRRSVRADMVRKNGKGAARLQKEKNGTITKDELVLFNKEGMHPLVWEFFVDELESRG